MGKDIRFYKEWDQRWYADLPEYIAQGGTKADCEMVAGADNMLEMLSEGRDQVTMHIELNPYQGCTIIELVEALEPGCGANYIIKKHNGVEINLNMWLCDVTKFVFGYFPKNIYFTSKLSTF